jgi:hypothetical protein
MRRYAAPSADRDEHGRAAALHFDDERGEPRAAVAQLLQVADPGLIDGDDDVVAADAGVAPSKAGLISPGGTGGETGLSGGCVITAWT